MTDNQLPRTTIAKYPFTAQGAVDLSTNEKGIDWPVVYILQGSKQAYVGETSSAYYRMAQHLENPVRDSMAYEYVLFNDLFNKSAILDIENMLIEHMHADGLFSLQNLNNGQSKYHNYYQRGLYKELFKNIWPQLRKEKLANHTLLQVENSDVFKYSPFKELTDEQYNLETKLLNDIFNAVSSKKPTTIVVEGGAGTGKSILAISLVKYIADLSSEKIDYSNIDSDSFDDLKTTITDYTNMNSILTDAHLSIAFVAPMTEFRNTIKTVFKNIPSLKKIDVVSPVDLSKKKGGYDVVIVDEAHHLATYGKSTSHLSFKETDDRLGFTDYKNTTQLDWIKKQSKLVTILFYDRKQSTSGADVPEKDFNFLEEAEGNKRYSLQDQIRLGAGEAYIYYWNKLLRNETTEIAPNFINTGYEFKVYDDCSKMMEDIKAKDKECDGLCRVLSGYGFPYTKTMRDQQGKRFNQDYDFIIDGVKYSWNGINENFATNPNSVNLIGSVFTSQGFDLNYAGVIFSNDIKYNKETGKIEAVPSNYFDKHGKVGQDISKTIEDILNSYLVLLTRGIRGTFVYACDSNLRDYIKEKFNNVLVK